MSKRKETIVRILVLLTAALWLAASYLLVKGPVARITCAIFGSLLLYVGASPL